MSSCLEMAFLNPPPTRELPRSGNDRPIGGPLSYSSGSPKRYQRYVGIRRSIERSTERVKVVSSKEGILDHQGSKLFDRAAPSFSRRKETESQSRCNRPGCFLSRSTLFAGQYRDKYLGPRPRNTRNDPRSGARCTLMAASQK